jgi:hypothetical protein
MGNSPHHTASIHILDDDSFLNIFRLYRPAIFDGDEDNIDQIKGGEGWDHERWWYKLAHVCQRWQILILRSASYLGLCLVCTRGTPVADMLAHSPPLPLVIDYFNVYDGIDVEDEEAIILALKQRDRVRLGMTVWYMLKLIIAIDEEYPVPEYLIMESTVWDLTSTTVMLPKTFQAPRLRYLLLSGFALPMGSRLLTTALGIVMLTLDVGYPSAYFQPNTLLQRLSFMPQLEKPLIVFLLAPGLNHDVERQLMHTSIISPVTLSNLRWIEFQVVSDYMETIVRRITTPRLEELRIQFFCPLDFLIPCLLHFMETTENLRIDSAKFEFSRYMVYVGAYPSLRKEVDVYPISINVFCGFLSRVSAVVQTFNSPGGIYPTVEHLTLEHKESNEEHNEVDRTE